MTRRSPLGTKEISNIIADAAIKLSPYPDAISVQELAAKSNMAIGTIYRVMPKKADLKNLMAKYVEEKFNSVIFTPIRASLDLKSRFSIVFGRINDFIDKEPECAKFLAVNGFDADCAFFKAAHAFVSEGVSLGIMDENIKNIAQSLIWGPIAAHIINRTNNIETGAVKDQEKRVWASLAA